MTRLDAFLRANGIRPARLAATRAVSRQHLLRLRRGTMEPKRSTMVRIAGACSVILRRRVHVSELFNLGTR